jgi:RPA family protein
LIRKLASWNPKLVDSISDDDFIKLLEKQNSYSNEDLSYLVAKRPNLLLEFMKTHINRFSWEQRQYIKQLLTEQPKQIESTPEPAPEITPEITEEKKDEEETTTASINLMVKVARRLDLKKKYRLADKLTYILDMKTSQ